jgi:two-component system KDP operon response regulator KdpE
MGLSDLDSGEVICRLQTWTEAPIIVLSGQSRPPDQISPASSRGASDVDTTRVRVGDVIVDLAARRVIRAHRQAEFVRQAADIRLTPTEWRLLEVLLRSPGRLLSRQYLLAQAWGPGYARATGNLRLYMAQLRRKLEPDPARPRWFVTEPGMGYRFQPTPHEAQRAQGPDHPDSMIAVSCRCAVRVPPISGEIGRARPQTVQAAAENPHRQDRPYRNR